MWALFRGSLLKKKKKANEPLLVDIVYEDSLKLQLFLFFILSLCFITNSFLSMYSCNKTREPRGTPQKHLTPFRMNGRQDFFGNTLVKGAGLKTCSSARAEK